MVANGGHYSTLTYLNQFDSVVSTSSTRVNSTVLRSTTTTSDSQDNKKLVITVSSTIIASVALLIFIVASILFRRKKLSKSCWEMVYDGKNHSDINKKFSLNSFLVRKAHGSQNTFVRNSCYDYNNKTKSNPIYDNSSVENSPDHNGNFLHHIAIKNKRKKRKEKDKRKNSNENDTTDAVFSITNKSMSDKRIEKTDAFNKFKERARKHSLQTSSNIINAHSISYKPDSTIDNTDNEELKYGVFHGVSNRPLTEEEIKLADQILELENMLYKQNTEHEETDDVKLDVKRATCGAKEFIENESQSKEIVPHCNYTISQNHDEHTSQTNNLVDSIHETLDRIESLLKFKLEEDFI